MGSQRGPWMAMCLLAAGFAVGRRSIGNSRSSEPETGDTVSAPSEGLVTSQTQVVVAGNANEFKTIFLLLVSLLHGNLFFALAAKSIPSVHELDAYGMSLVVLSYTVYFRVLQSHVVAALKYDARWRLRPFDFVLVFITVVFEFALFTREDVPWLTNNNLRVMLICFAIFGAVGYAVTYLRTRAGMKAAGYKNEWKLQTVNVAVLLAMAVLYLADLKWISNLDIEVAINYVVSGCLWANVYLSIRWSKLPI